MCRRPLTAPTSARCATGRMCTAVTGRSCSELSTKVRQHVWVNFELFLCLFFLFFHVAFSAPANTHSADFVLCWFQLLFLRSASWRQQSEGPAASSWCCSVSLWRCGTAGGSTRTTTSSCIPESRSGRTPACGEGRR